MANFNDVILFSTGCPKCKVLENKLKDKNVEFKKNVDTDTMKKMGLTSVPVLRVNGSLLNFVEANKWVNGLRA